MTEETPIRENICGSCPFLKTSVRGTALGVYDGRPYDFLFGTWEGLTRVPCKKHQTWEDPMNRNLGDAKLCRGLLVMMQNEKKIPLDPVTRECRDQTSPSHSVFGSLRDFILHHSTKYE